MHSCDTDNTEATSNSELLALTLTTPISTSLSSFSATAGFRHERGNGFRVEVAISIMKRIFGKYVSAWKFVNVTKEMDMKVSTYNRFTAMKRIG